MGDFLKAFDKSNKASKIPLPKLKFGIGFTKANDELLGHCYKDIPEQLNRQIRFSFRFEKNKTCVFSIKKSEQNGDQFILTEVLNLGCREIKHLYKNCSNSLPFNLVHFPKGDYPGKLTRRETISEEELSEHLDCPSG